MECVDALIQQPSRQVGSPRDGWQRELESELDGEPDHGYAMRRGETGTGPVNRYRVCTYESYIVWVGSKACTTVRVTT